MSFVDALTTKAQGSQPHLRDTLFAPGCNLCSPLGEEAERDRI